MNIEKLDHQGRGIGRIDNKVVFVSNALPNEVVDIKIVQNKKNYMLGEVISYQEISSKRIEPNCPYFDICGGCDLLHMNYDDQLIYKENKVKEIMAKYADLTSIIKPIIATNNKKYRNKVTFQVKEKIGFYKNDSSELIPISSCLLLDDKMNTILNRLQTINLNNIIQIVIRSSKNTNDLMVVFVVENYIDEKAIISLLKDTVTSIMIKSKENYKTIYGNSTILEKIGALSFSLSPASFFQVNTIGATILYDKVLEYCDLSKQDKVLDLYCGTGSIGLYLSKYCDKVLGIETNKYAVIDAYKNKELNNIDNINFICNDASKIDLNFKPSIVIIDPPRNGLNDETIRQIIKIKPDKIIYVSCDPLTLARDLKAFKEQYNVLEITPIDMFPNTYHVECVVKLVIKKG